MMMLCDRRDNPFGFIEAFLSFNGPFTDYLPADSSIDITMDAAMDASITLKCELISSRLCN